MDIAYNEIINEIASLFQCEPTEIVNKGKSIDKRNLTDARAMLCYTLHYDWLLSVNQISHILHHQKRGIFKKIVNAKNLLENNKEFRKKYEKIQKRELPERKLPQKLKE